MEHNDLEPCIKDRDQLMQEWLINDSLKKPAHDLLLKFTIAASQVQFPMHTMAFADHSALCVMFKNARIILQKAISYCVGELCSMVPLLQWLVARFLFATWPQTQFFSMWKQRLLEMNVNLKTYTAVFFRQPFGVYILLNPKTDHCYIGATSCSLSGRYSPRLRKLRQIMKGRFVEAEVALRFWARTRSFHDYIPILVTATESKEAAFIQEALLQQKFQPSLCMPWILSHHKEGQNSVNVPKHTKTGMKLFKRFRHSQIRESRQDSESKHKSFQFVV